MLEANSRSDYRQQLEKGSGVEADRGERDVAGRKAQSAEQALRPELLQALESRVWSASLRERAGKVPARGASGKAVSDNALSLTVTTRCHSHSPLPHEPNRFSTAKPSDSGLTLTYHSH